ncbi:MAG: arsenate reductase ArsC [Saprospiraceae bacterium]|nr:arsenate reductase ArsC [Saprospiraceae bacterium]
MQLLVARDLKVVKMKRILVLCTGNSCRSQMMHGYLSYFGKEAIEVRSAGIETHGVNPNAIKYMGEDGVDISDHTSNNISEYLDESFDYLVTVCDHANETCPVFPTTAKKIHYDFHDPSKVEGSEEAVAAAFRKTRDQIKAFSVGFLGAL